MSKRTVTKLQDYMWVKTVFSNLVRCCSIISQSNLKHTIWHCVNFLRNHSEILSHFSFIAISNYYYSSFIFPIIAVKYARILTYKCTNHRSNTYVFDTVLQEETMVRHVTPGLHGPGKQKWIYQRAWPTKQT